MDEQTILEWLKAALTNYRHNERAGFFVPSWVLLELCQLALKAKELERESPKD